MPAVDFKSLIDAFSDPKIDENENTLKEKHQKL